MQPIRGKTRRTTTLILEADRSGPLGKTLRGSSRLDVHASHDPARALARIRRTPPGVVAVHLDDFGQAGILFVEELMRAAPVPIVVWSRLSPRGAELAARALSLGAADVVGFTESADGWETRLVAASRADTTRLRSPAPPKALHAPIPPGNSPWKLIALVGGIGATEALRALLPQLPLEAAPVLAITHHSPELLKAFAASVGRDYVMEMRNWTAGEKLDRGKIHLAGARDPFGVERRGSFCYASPLERGEGLPIDRMLQSVAYTFGRGCIAVALTGAGTDGAKGLACIRAQGGHTIAQAPETAAHPALSMAAAKLDTAAEIENLEDIPLAIRALFGRRVAA